MGEGKNENKTNLDNYFVLSSAYVVYACTCVCSMRVCEQYACVYSMHVCMYAVCKYVCMYAVSMYVCAVCLCVCAAVDVEFRGQPLKY